jgi:hypothetical protein
MAPAKRASGFSLCGSVGAPGRGCALALPACDDGSQSCAGKCSQRNRGRPGQGPRREDAACAGETGTDRRFEQSPRAAVRLPSVQKIPEALRCGGDCIAVDAVLAIVEQDDYPNNDRGQILLPS